MEFIKDSLKLYGTLFKDIFLIGGDKQSTHGWCRYPLYPKNKTDQNKMLRKIKTLIKENQTIKNENTKR
tara:strand:+ start:271 stop:477 length:207 start_codon:yes stop_codon:yes gene_type:complete